MKTRKAGCLFGLIKLFVLTAIILVALIYFSLFLIVPMSVHYVGKVMGIDMDLDSFSMSIIEQSVELENFYINNPDGFDKETKAINLNKARIDLGLGVSDLYFNNLIVIDEIMVDGFELSVEYAGGIGGVITNESNLNAILSKLQTEEKLEEQEQAQAQASTADAEKEYKLIIKKVSFKNGKVAGSISGAKVNLPLPDFEILDLGVKEGGVSPTSAGLTIFSSVSYQAIKSLTSNTIDKTGEVLNDGFNAVKSIFDGF